MAVWAQKLIAVLALTKELRKVLPGNCLNDRYTLTDNVLAVADCCPTLHIKHAVSVDNGGKNITNKTQGKRDLVSFPRKHALNALVQRTLQLKGARNISWGTAFANIISHSISGICIGRNYKSKSLNAITQESYWSLKKILASTIYSQEAKAAPTNSIIVFGAIGISILLRTILLMKSLSVDARLSLKDFNLGCRQDGYNRSFVSAKFLAQALDRIGT